MEDRKFNLGLTYEQKLIKLLIIDNRFMQSFVTLIKSSYFSFTVNQQLFKIIQRYYFQYKTAINYDILAMQLKKVDNAVLRKSIEQKVIQIIDLDIQVNQVKYIKQNTLQFIKNRQLEMALQYSNKLISKQEIDYEKIRIRIHNALQLSINQDKGSQLVATFDQRYSGVNRNPIKTGWVIINNHLNGGLGAGQLGVIMAASGVGKSWGLVNLGVAAAKQGKRVLHYTGQLSRDYTNMRYDSVITGIPFTQLYHHNVIVMYVIKQFFFLIFF